ncbi:MAG: hypothetical protein RR235_04950 [Oscillospiraceae bacterium]
MKLFCTVEGLETLDADMEAINARVRAAAAEAMPFLAERLKESLRRHIDTDVYGAYSPKEYPRRSHNPEFGTPLNDVETNTLTVVRMNGVLLDYKPSGAHSGTTADLSPYSAWYDADDPRPLVPNPANGDELVRRIESGNGYDWGGFDMARPFFGQFVTEQIEGGEAEYNLVSIMNMVDSGLLVTVSGSSIRDESDWK